MQGKLVPVKLPPGMWKNGTKYQASGRWYDGSLVRFIDGTIRPIGGWRAFQNASAADLQSLSGMARGAIAYRSQNGAFVRVGVGTHTKLYGVVQGSLFDITPTGFVAGSESSSFSSGGGAYGGGAYGAGPYGTGSSASTLLDADTWQLDNFGDFLVGVFTADGKLYYWDGVAAKAVQATGSPVNNRGVVVTPERFLVALGAGGDVRNVQWATQEGGLTVAGDWTPGSTTTAGSFPLPTRGRIVSGRRTKTETLIFTDSDLWRMTYIGQPLLYAFAQAGDNCGIVAPNAVSIIDTNAYWMGKNAFYAYNGFVQQIPCDVRDYVFSDINRAQLAKIFSATIAQYGEIWWFYPSSGSTEIDRYAVYNRLENHWTVGKLVRVAGFDAGAWDYPVMIEPDYAAIGTLTSDGTNVANGDTVTIGGKTYTFQTTLTNVDGNVHIGANAAGSLDNLFRAINLGSGSGTDYAAAMTKHPTVQGESDTATTVVIRALASGSGGNSIATTETSAHLSWGAATLQGGGASTGLRVVNLREHEVTNSRSNAPVAPYLESGPFELGDGDQLTNLVGFIPDDKTLGDVTAKFFGAMFPDDTETSYGPYTLSKKTDVRIMARQLRVRVDEAVATDWRVGTIRGLVVPGPRR